MKHFFFPYDEKSCSDGILKFLLNKANTDDEMQKQKAYYDMIDIIHDKRFERDDKELNNIFTDIKEKVPEDNELKGVSSKGKQLRTEVLKGIWCYIEGLYKDFDAKNSKVFYRVSTSDKQAKSGDDDISMKYVLFHLVRGN